MKILRMFYGDWRAALFADILCLMHIHLAGYFILLSLLLDLPFVFYLVCLPLSGIVIDGYTE